MEKTLITPVKILDIPVHPYTMSAAVDIINARIQEQERTFVITANAEIIMLGHTNEEYKQILYKADLVLADGAGTVWGGRKLGYNIPERVAGYDLFVNLIATSVNNGAKAFFLGASPGIAAAAKLECEKRYPGCKIVGVHDGYFKDTEIPDLLHEINQSGAKMLFLALGAPKQEQFIINYLDQLKPYLLMGIGGSFDVLAGKMERAPQWMQDASLEWLFRLYKQPSRFKRMLVLPKFVIKIFCAKPQA